MEGTNELNAAGWLGESESVYNGVKWRVSVILMDGMTRKMTDINDPITA